ncbi:hypothetical protein BB560_006396, partial [Smittium megazygosporum]
TEGDLVGISGLVISVQSDGTVRVKIDTSEIARGSSRSRGQPIMSFQQKQLRKYFRPGDHVKVIRGKSSGLTGSVVAVEDLIVTLISDLSLNEVKVFAKDLIQSKEVVTSVSENKFDKNEMVFLDSGRVSAIVLASEKGMYKVLDQNNQFLIVKEYEVSPMYKRANQIIATDSTGQEIKKGDIVKELSGLRRSGMIVQLNRFVAFIKSESISENSGIFPARVRNLISSASRQTYNRNSSNPNFQPRQGFQGNRGNQNARKSAPAFRGRDPIIGQYVIITRGPSKGYMGIVKTTSGNIARIELHTSARIVNVERDKLDVKLKDGRTVPAVSFGTFGGQNGSDLGDSSGFPSPYSNTKSLPFTPGAPGNASSSYGGSWEKPNISSDSSSAWGSGTPSVSNGDGWNQKDSGSSWGSGTPSVSNDNAWDQNDSGSTAGWGSGGGGGQEASTDNAWDQKDTSSSSGWGGASTQETSNQGSWDQNDTSPSSAGWGSGGAPEASNDSGWNQKDTGSTSGWGGGASTQEVANDSTWDQKDTESSSGRGSGAKETSNESAWGQPDTGASSGWDTGGATGGGGSNSNDQNSWGYSDIKNGVNNSGFGDDYPTPNSVDGWLNSVASERVADRGDRSFNNGNNRRNEYHNNRNNRRNNYDRQNFSRPQNKPRSSNYQGSDNYNPRRNREYNNNYDSHRGGYKDSNNRGSEWNSGSFDSSHSNHTSKNDATSNQNDDDNWGPSTYDNDPSSNWGSSQSTEQPGSGWGA